MCVWVVELLQRKSGCKMEPKKTAKDGQETKEQVPDYPCQPSETRLLSSKEIRNMRRFIFGIMCFKLGFESLSTCMALLAVSRFHRAYAVTMMSVLVSCFATAQAISSLAAASLLAWYPSHRIMAVAVWAFASLVTALLLLEVLTGGTLEQPGTWSPFLIVPLYTAMGACVGVLGLIRRTIPTVLVGLDPEKLQHVDATAHIFFEIAATVGAFASAPLISRLGCVYGLLLLPPLFVAAGWYYWHLDVEEGCPRVVDGNKSVQEESASTASSSMIRRIRGLHHAVGAFFTGHLHSVRVGARIVFSSRRFSWLLLGYTLPYILHRLIEDVIFPSYAKLVLHHGAYSGFLLGSSNMGQLLGALLVLVLSRRIPTPLPFVRWDALALSLCWVFALGPPAGGAVHFLSAVAPLLLCVSGGWAAGDVSLLAYIQTHIGNHYTQTENEVSPLGAVVSFLYSSYIIGYTALSIGVGQFLDRFNARGEPETGFFWISGVFLSLCGVVILLSTFLPPGSWALNPTAGEMEEDDEEEEEEVGEEDEDVEVGGCKTLSGVDTTIFYTPASSLEAVDDKKRRRRRKQYVCFGPEVTVRRYTAENKFYRLWVTPI